MHTLRTSLYLRSNCTALVGKRGCKVTTYGTKGAHLLALAGVQAHGNHARRAEGSTFFCHKRTMLGSPACSLARVACAQARASRLSFADIVRRLAALPEEDSAYVSSKARTPPACQPVPPMRPARVMPGRICLHSARWLVPVPACVRMAPIAWGPCPPTL